MAASYLSKSTHFSSFRRALASSRESREVWTTVWVSKTGREMKAKAIYLGDLHSGRVVCLFFVFVFFRARYKLYRENQLSVEV